MSEPQHRFVLLHHVMPDGEHWDLMLESGNVLATWQLQVDPGRIVREELTVASRRIADHRIAYLEYEGPVSGNRGHVTRVDQGTYEVVSSNSSAEVIRFRGNLLRNWFFNTARNVGESGEFGAAAGPAID